MAVTLHNIPGRTPSPFYSAAAAGQGNTTIFISGQVGEDETGAVVPGGLAAQAERAFLNVALALEAAGATVADIVKMTIYVKDWDVSKMGELGQGSMAARARYPFGLPATTLLSVSQLFVPEHLIEIEAVSVVDR